MSWPIGIFAAAGAGLLVVLTIGWRWLFVIGMLPALLAYIIRRRVPESPRWLAAHGRNEEARVAFDRAIALANTSAEAAHIRMHLDRLIRDSQPSATTATKK